MRALTNAYLYFDSSYVGFIFRFYSAAWNSFEWFFFGKNAQESVITIRYAQSLNSIFIFIFFSLFHQFIFWIWLKCWDFVLSVWICFSVVLFYFSTFYYYYSESCVLSFSCVSLSLIFNYAYMRVVYIKHSKLLSLDLFEILWIFVCILDSCVFLSCVAVLFSTFFLRWSPSLWFL